MRTLIQMIGAIVFAVIFSYGAAELLFARFKAKQRRERLECETTNTAKAKTAKSKSA